MGAWNATCCDDGITGCPVGFTCIANAQCLARPEIVTDPLVQVLPRYKLCHVPEAVQSPHFFPLDDYYLPYYSSHGDLYTDGDAVPEQLPSHAVVVIHGAGRNADDYFCTLLSVVQQDSSDPSMETAVVIAPHFASLEDSIRHNRNDGHRILQWNETDSLGGDNPWRYGADAAFRDSETGTIHATGISSFEVMDQIVRRLLESCERVTVVGHSAGGQFVQRWALLTPWSERLRAVVANPSSYAYLSNTRYDERQEKWFVPSRRNDCPLYNSWEWGLEEASDGALRMTTPSYVRSVLQMNTRSQLIERFSQRRVFYLAGSLDYCNVSQYDQSGWCYSHGLETTCMDQLQGSNRLARHLHYVESLESLSINVLHAVVPGVGHDHSLMFHSREGRLAILGKPSSFLERVDDRSDSSLT